MSEYTPVFVFAGFVLTMVGVMLTIGATNRKTGERMAVLETKMEYIAKAVDDIKKGAGLTRRCSDCNKTVDKGD